MKEESDPAVRSLRAKYVELREKHLSTEHENDSLESEICFKQDTLVSLTEQLAHTVYEFGSFSNCIKKLIMALEEEAENENYWTESTAEANILVQLTSRKLKTARAGRQAVADVEELIISESIESEELGLLESQALLSTLQQEHNPQRQVLTI